MSGRMTYDLVYAIYFSVLMVETIIFSEHCQQFSATFIFDRLYNLFDACVYSSFEYIYLAPQSIEYPIPQENILWKTKTLA